MARDGRRRAGSDGRQRGGGVVPVLYVKYNGGKELHDGSGHLPRDAQGFYLSRTTGERLLVDTGWSQGDAVGAPKVYGLLTAVVMGAPTGRRSGFAFTDTEYILLTLSNNAFSFMAATQLTTTTFDVLIATDSPGGTDRAIVSRNASLGLRTLIEDAVGGLESTDTNNVSTGVDYILCGSWDGLSTGKRRAQVRLGSDGSLVESAEDATGVTPDLTGEVWLVGRHATGFAGQYWRPAVSVGMAWDGDPDVDFAAVAAAIAAGTDVDTLRATYGAALCSDGWVCGGYDPANNSDLFFLGVTSGDDVTAEYA